MCTFVESKDQSAIRPNGDRPVEAPVLASFGPQSPHFFKPVPEAQGYLIANVLSGVALSLGLRARMPSKEGEYHGKLCRTGPQHGPNPLESHANLEIVKEPAREPTLSPGPDSGNYILYVFVSPMSTPKRHGHLGPCFFLKPIRRT